MTDSTSYMSADMFDEDGRAMTGDSLLDRVHAFLGRFISYPSEHAHAAHALWIIHAHLMDRWESTPRIAFLSPEPGSGKSRCLEVTAELVPRPVQSVNSTPAYLFRKVSDEAGLPTILYDEIDTVFGPKAKDNEDVRGMLNAGHRRGATAGRCVVKGKTVETEEFPAYCAVALAGLNDLPDTIMTRAVVVRMRRRASGERVEPWRLRVHGPAAHALRDDIAAWAASVPDVIDEWPEMPLGIEDRDADVWEALIVVADLAGGPWPDVARRSAVAAITDSRGDTRSLGILLLRDLRTVFGDRDAMPTEDILKALVEIDESPWGDLRGKPLDARGLSKRLGVYGVKPGNIRRGDRVLKGYTAMALRDPWSRYVAADDPSSWEYPQPQTGDQGDVGVPPGNTVPAATPLQDAGPAESATSATPLPGTYDLLDVPDDGPPRNGHAQASGLMQQLGLPIPGTTS